MKYGDEIVINRMYNGNYLNDNLGHEIINLYKSDNGNNYIYLNHLGTFSANHSGKIGVVLMVRTVPGKKTLEVLGKAEELTDVYNCGDMFKEQSAYIVENNVTYGGVRVDKLFSKNTYQQDVFITFKAEKVLRPKEPTYIRFIEKEGIQHKEENYLYMLENKQAKASLKQYITIETPKDYETLFNYLKDETNWHGESETLKEEEVDYEPDNMFKICGIEDSELAFSNALGYFFVKYPNLISGFLKHVGYDYTPSEEMSVVRESESNIDVLIKDKNDVVLIENKIKSHINGIIFSRHSKDGEYSQLEKYYNYVMKNYGRKRIKCFVLTPDYNDIDLKPYKASEHYTKIYYSQLYDFLFSADINDSYLKEFILAIKKHTKKYNNELYYEMKRRFYESINQYKR